MKAFHLTRVKFWALAGVCLLGADFSRPDPASFTLGTTTEVEIRRPEEMASFLGQLYNREVGGDDVVTVIRFSEIRG